MSNIQKRKYKIFFFAFFKSLQNMNINKKSFKLKIKIKVSNKINPKIKN